MLIKELQQIQEDVGFLPEEELQLLSQRTNTPLYALEGVSTFYPHFHREPPPLVEVSICRDMACHMHGAADLLRTVEAGLGDLRRPAAGEAVPPNLVHVRGASCLGRCDRVPAACINEELYLGRSAEELCGVAKQRLAIRLQETGQPQLLDSLSLEVSESPPTPDRDADLEVGHAAWDIDCYQGSPTYDAVQAFVRAMAEETGQGVEQERKRILEALNTAGLRGMGGAGARTFKKWREVRDAMEKLRVKLRTPEVDAYVVCNGDESEPGTFKDRELLLRTPHLVLEGVILAGLFLQAKAGYIYIRHEYKEQIKAMRQEIARAEKQNFCGDNVLASGLAFPVEVVESPGGYICGEQTALIEALEGKRAEPRNRPPAMQENGLWDKPTLLNNVETFAWVPAIVLQEDGRHYAELARSEKYRGKRFFSVSGDVNRPGVYEAPNGIRLGDLIDLAGGASDEFQAVALSGPSGGFLPRRLPREFVGNELEETQKKLAPTFQSLSQSSRELHQYLTRLITPTPATTAAITDPPTQRGMNSRDAVVAALHLVQELIARLESFQGDFEPVAQSLQQLHDTVQNWAKEQGALDDSDGNLPATPGDRREELTIKLARRTVALGRSYTSVRKSTDKLESLLAEMFPQQAATFDVLDLRLDKQDSYAVGFMLGAGIVVYGSRRNMLAQALNCLRFFRNESCGQCVPCRIGSQKLVGIAEKLSTGSFDGDAWKNEKNLVEALSKTMKETSICGLGEVAANPFTSLLRYFQEQIDQRLK